MKVREREGAHRNNAESSSNPFANAKTASLDPSFLKANIARYLSNNDNFGSSSVFSSSGIEADSEEEEVGRAAE